MYWVYIVVAGITIAVLVYCAANRPNRGCR